MSAVTSTTSSITTVTATAKVGQVMCRLARNSTTARCSAGLPTPKIISTNTKKSVSELVAFFGGGKIHARRPPSCSSEVSTNDFEWDTDEDEEEIEVEVENKDKNATAATATSCFNASSTGNSTTHVIPGRRTTFGDTIDVSTTNTRANPSNANANTSAANNSATVRSTVTVAAATVVKDQAQHEEAPSRADQEHQQHSKVIAAREDPIEAAPHGQTHADSLRTQDQSGVIAQEGDDQIDHLDHKIQPEDQEGEDEENQYESNCAEDQLIQQLAQLVAVTPHARQQAEVARYPDGHLDAARDDSRSRPIHPSSTANVCMHLCV